MSGKKKDINTYSTQWVEENSCPEPMSGCWLWTATIAASGYGVHSLNYAHRISWVTHNGPILNGLHVCHHCDTPPCVNPAHLFLGTARDNLRDCAAKGRCRPQRLVGASNPNAILNEAKVAGIVSHLRAGKTTRHIASLYGVSQTAISEIGRGRRWRHITGGPVR